MSGDGCVKGEERSVLDAENCGLCYVGRSHSITAADLCPSPSLLGDCLLVVDVWVIPDLQKGKRKSNFTYLTTQNNPATACQLSKLINEYFKTIE